MRLIDADALYGEAEMWYKGAPTPFRKIYRSFVDAVADAPTIAPPSNDPLTLEELREMDGEPVWVVEINGYPPRWGLVYWYRKNKRDIVYVTINNGASICAETSMTAGVKIYRRKPEEGTNVGS